jgi:hypothetical protein
MNLFQKTLNIVPPQYRASKWAFMALFCSILTISLPSCKVKEGCPTKSFTNTMDKNSKHGKSNLFDKKMRKQMKNK